MKRVFLVGYMGVGKTTAGKELAKPAGLSLINLDYYIEGRYHKAVSQIFVERGEEAFREIERNMPHEAVEFEGVLISTGGGTPCFFDNMEFMNASGTTVYLEVSVEELAKHLELCKHTRPMLEGRSEGELRAFTAESLEKRNPFYARASITFDVEKMLTESDVHDISNALMKILQHMEANDGRQAQGAYIPQELLKEISKVNNRLLIGIPRERYEAEKRLSLTSEAADILTDCGHRVLVESGTGSGIDYSDNHFSGAGAEIVDTPAETFQADLILKILPPPPVEIALMRPRTTVLSSVQLNLFAQEAFELMMAKRITAISYELMAGEYNRFLALNVTSEIEGAASITITSELLSNTQGGKGILLGGIPGVSPTEVVIIGAGNAGTVAARAALALGASVKVFDDDINKLRIIQQVLGQGLFTSTFHPNVLYSAFRSTGMVIGAMRYINMRHRCTIATDLVRMMKRGALVIDLRVSQGGCFETTCYLSKEDSAVFEQYGVLHYRKLNINNRVAHTTSMAYSNIFVPLLLSSSDAGSMQGMIKSDKSFRAGICMYYGKTVNNYVSNHFNLSSNSLDLYFSAF